MYVYVCIYVMLWYVRVRDLWLVCELVHCGLRLMILSAESNHLKMVIYKL